jgi:hypothetical protein
MRDNADMNRRLSSLALLLASPLVIFTRALAQTTEWTEANGCISNISVDGGATQFPVATIRGAECLLANVLQVAVTFIGLAGFVMFIVGAFLYLTSGGNQKGTTAAKQTVTYAIAGIVVSLFSFFILNLIADFTGTRGFMQFNLNIGN